MNKKQYITNIASTLNCRGEILDLSDTAVMGIINLTDDSFYKGSRAMDVEGLLHKAGQMLDEGAAILDIGAMSTRPGAGEIPEEKELHRIEEAVTAVSASWPDAIISVDTYRASVARAAIEKGAHIINDISGYSFDPGMPDFLKEHRPAYILMHNKARPDRMTEVANYDNLQLEVFDYFQKKVEELKSWGLEDIVLDPGFGFSKRIPHNFELLNSLSLFKRFGLPVLAGISRKSLIYSTLGIKPEDSLNGTTVLNTLAVERGASILRVHDVREAIELVSLLKKI